MNLQMQDKEILVKAEGLSKKFCKDLKTSLWYGVKDLIANLSSDDRKRTLRDKEFWAVKDINFELRRGECLGLIGHNGAGKSTLLKILNGLIKPDEGKVTIKGKVGALIELGAGFNPILSGRENIYNNGAVLGFSREEIREKIEDIIEFAELSEFIDMPVQNYSSGMKVRLGFAVAAQMQPDVLIIDEVLAVGDLGFVLKCFKTIDRILPNTAIVFVSHSMPMVSRICNQIILMDKGISKFQGKDVAGAIDLYYSQFVTNDSNLVFDDGSLELKEVKVNSMDPSHQIQVHWEDDFKIDLKFRLLNDIPVPDFFLIITDKEQRQVALLKNLNNTNINPSNGILNFSVLHKNIQLSKGIYSISITARSSINKEPIYRQNSIINFQLIHKDEVWEPFLLNSTFTDLSNP